MMLTFIFKYTWIGMIILAYIIWSVKLIKDIIRTKDIYKNSFDICFLDESSMAWILVSFGIIFCGSLLYWVFGGVE